MKQVPAISTTEEHVRLADIARDRARRFRWPGALRVAAATSALAILGTLAVGCGDDDGGKASAATSDNAVTTVSATEKDGTITLDSATSDNGNVRFAISNDGELTHQFVVLKTDLADGDLPLTADGRTVDQSGPGVTEVGMREDIAPGAEAELAFEDLAPGKYVLICNVAGHYGLGMHTPFTVS